VDLKRKKIGVLMGGLSVEREVSLRSGAMCLKALRERGYHAVAVDAVRDVAQRLDEEQIEVAFLALHGRFGEDGTIQGMLELLDIPYTGSGVLASAVGMHKVCSKKVVRQSGLPTPDFLEVSADADPGELAARVARELGFPVMLKPVEEGSSVGVHKCHNEQAVVHAIEQDRERYGPLFVEAFVSGMEITVGVLEGPLGLVALPILELVPKNEFYDYEAKYTHGMTEFIIPARLSDGVTREAMRLSVEAFRILGCSGYARVDFMVESDGTCQFTEVNTLPGMTDLSDLPAQARAAGIDYPELVERILKTALLPKH